MLSISATQKFRQGRTSDIWQNTLSIFRILSFWKDRTNDPVFCFKFYNFIWNILYKMRRRKRRHRVIRWNLNMRIPTSDRTLIATEIFRVISLTILLFLKHLCRFIRSWSFKVELASIFYYFLYLTEIRIKMYNESDTLNEALNQGQNM